MSVLDLAPPFETSPRQCELADVWYDDETKQVLACGAIRAGKTQAAARLLVEEALTYQSQYLVARMTYRELADTTQRAMLDGDGALPPLIPREVIREVRKTDNLVHLHGGSTILFRSLDEPGKLLNLTLGGMMIDQAEELDEGPAGERIYDTLLGRLSDPRSRRKAMLVANPGPTTHWLHRRFVDARTADPRGAYVHFTLRDNPFLLDEYVADMEATAETRPHWYRCYVLGEWGSFEGAAFQELETATHVVAAFALPNEWLRTEGMDHGTNNPTAWLLAASDYDGNLLVWDEYYAPGLVSEHAAQVWQRRREQGWWARDKQGELEHATCFADPSIKNKYGLSDPTGRELSVEVEFGDHGIGFAPGQNDRRVGYARILELLHPDPERRFPVWHPKAGQPGAPRLYLTSRCERTIEQLRNAPVKAEGKDALDIVDPVWESAHGHAVAALRYLTMGRMGPSVPPAVYPDDPREAYIEERARRLADPDYEPEEDDWDA